VPSSRALPRNATLFAPAKLTVDLRVTGLRDDGMHLIDAEMVTLDFGDELVVSEGTGVRYRGAWSGEGDENDLVSRALALVGEQRQVDVEKRIPAGAGLGGGSADAAAILRAAGFDDLEAAARLGADVAFCLVGGRANVSGIGEVVEPMPFVERTYTLLTPPLHCSTPAVYRAWDEMGGPTGEHGNDLEPAALVVEPQLARWRDRLSEESGTRARLAGSGSTWFVEGAYTGDGFVVARTTPPEDT
jgi:4-diphosphocytidyl-2-C-methyl-D-erythritol kinase